MQWLIRSLFQCVCVRVCVQVGWSHTGLECDSSNENDHYF